MPRANRHYLPGHVWHITHRCHKGEFLLKFSRDKRAWIRWLREARRRFGLTVLNYMVTSNHIHLLVLDDSGKGVVSDSLRLVAGRTAQQYNARKNRRGAFWEDRYHATAVESGIHLARCVAYIDTNMVRAGQVGHPGEWPFCGYREIREPRRRVSLINLEKLAEATGCGSVDQMRENHRAWVEPGPAGNCAVRRPEWTGAVAVGSRSFVEDVRQGLGLDLKIRGRQVERTGDGYCLRERCCSYSDVFGVENGDISPENTYFWR